MSVPGLFLQEPKRDAEKGLSGLVANPDFGAVSGLAAIGTLMAVCAAILFPIGFETIWLLSQFP